MKLVCPECGATGSIAQFTSDVDARAVCEQLAALAPELATPLLRYLGLFRPAKRALTWPHARRLLVDVTELMHSPAVRRRGRDWPVTSAMWRTALTQMTEQRARLTLPLKSHGYLLEIVAGLADKAEAKAEDRHEAELRAGFQAGQDAPARISQQALVDAETAALIHTHQRLGLPPPTKVEIQRQLEKRGLS